MNKPPYLRQWMEERGQRSDVVAREINMTPATFSRRLKGDGAFHLSEAHIICAFLGQDYTVLFPNNDGIDPRDIEALKYASLVSVA